MNLEFNENAKEGRIVSAFNRVMQDLSNNLQNGNEYTEIYVDKDIGGEVRRRLEAEFEKQGKADNFEFCVVDKRRNDLGNHRMMYFTGMTVGDQKYYKLRYKK